jgi:hypothetical protein
MLSLWPALSTEGPAGPLGEREGLGSAWIPFAESKTFPCGSTFSSGGGVAVVCSMRGISGVVMTFFEERSLQDKSMQRQTLAD